MSSTFAKCQQTELFKMIAKLKILFRGITFKKGEMRIIPHNLSVALHIPNRISRPRALISSHGIPCKSLGEWLHQQVTRKAVINTEESNFSSYSIVTVATRIKKKTHYTIHEHLTTYTNRFAKSVLEVGATLSVTKFNRVRQSQMVCASLARNMSKESKSCQGFIQTDKLTHINAEMRLG